MDVTNIVQAGHNDLCCSDVVENLQAEAVCHFVESDCILKSILDRSWVLYFRKVVCQCHVEKDATRFDGTGASWTAALLHHDRWAREEEVSVDNALRCRGAQSGGGSVVNTFLFQILSHSVHYLSCLLEIKESFFKTIFFEARNALVVVTNGGVHVVVLVDDDEELGCDEIVRKKRSRSPSRALPGLPATTHASDNQRWMWRTIFWTV